MINIVYGGTEAFDAVIYGENHPANLDFFRNQVQSVSNTLSDIGNNFFANTQQMYEDINGSLAMRRLRAAARTAKGLFASNVISDFSEIGQFQQAPSIMQRFIMSEPTVRAMYQKQIIAGYPDSYVDMHPGTIGDTHYDYQRVMNGVVDEDKDGRTVIRYYDTETLEGDKNLCITEKADIISTWEILQHFVKYGLDDPTSPINDKL